MKYMNIKKRFLPLNLQLFAESNDGGEGSDGDDAGGDDQDDDKLDEGGDDDDSSEKKYTEEEMEAAVKKRLAREKRKWKRGQDKQRNTSGGKDSGNNDSGDDDDELEIELRDKAAKADDLELKWTCLEHDVDKAYVDDVLALAKTRMAKDEDLDIEDAIDAVLKKYPHFKESSKDGDDDDETKGKAWGQRQNGQRRKTSGVEAAFLKKNPGLKIE